MPGLTHAGSRALSDHALAWLRGHVGDIMLASGAWATLLGAPRDVVIALFRGRAVRGSGSASAATHATVDIEA